MNFEEFINARDRGEIPKDLHPLLKVLLIDASGDWDTAHRMAQKDYTKNGSWVHAYLHRKEGDLGNAAYWYRSAGRKMPDQTLEEEWEEIVKELLGMSH